MFDDQLHKDIIYPGPHVRIPGLRNGTHQRNMKNTPTTLVKLPYLLGALGGVSFK